MMKKNVITTIAFIAVALFTTNSFAQDRQRGERREPPKPAEVFEKLDANEDGLLTKEEIEEDDRMGKRMLEDFDTIDTDESSDISLEELETYFENRKKDRKKRS